MSAPPETKLDSFTLSPSQTSTQTQTISSTMGGLGDSSLGSAGVVTVTFSDLLMNGGIAAAGGLITAVAILYAIIIFRKGKRALLLTSTPITAISTPQKNFLTSSSSSASSSSSFSVMNPLQERQQRPQLLLPMSRPTKSSNKSVSSKRSS